MHETTPRISFIIPAYNEAVLIGATIRQIAEAARAVSVSSEIIVADDASEDGTATIAQRAGARVVHIAARQIAAARNAGAGAARGDVLVFVDADTLLPPETLAAALEALDEGAVGGGATVRFRGRTPLPSRVLLSLMQHPMRWMGTCGGCFLFTRREHFDRLGGFDEQYFASEEVHFARGLAKLKQGPFVILREITHTSGRKVRTYSLLRLLWILSRLSVRGPAGFRSRRGMEIWYDGERESAGMDN